MTTPYDPSFEAAFGDGEHRFRLCGLKEWAELEDKTGGSMFVLLDRSGSMQDDNRWGEVTAALSAFVDDPAAAGLGLGLQLYPLGITSDDCAPEKFAQQT